MGQLIQTRYQVPFGFHSPHLQTVLPTLMRKPLALPVQWERLELDDGDFIDLAWYNTASVSHAPLVLLMHGLEGSLQSHYATPLMYQLQQAGFNVVFMSLRGRGREPNRLARSYHSGASADLAEVLAKLHQRGQTVQAAVGISLSANLLLKYLGEPDHQNAFTPLQAAVAISVPFQLATCATQLEHGFARVYGQHLLKQLKQSYQTKFNRLASPLKIDLAHIKTLYQFDDAITAPLNGFQSADDYYQRCSCAPFLPHITTPTLIIHALDDPFMTPDVVPTPHELGAAVQLELSPYGGHVGFIQGHHGRLSYYLDQRVVEFLSQSLVKPVNP